MKERKIVNYPVPNQDFEGTHIVSLLNESKNSLVYKVWNETLSVHRAVKMLKKESSDEAQSRFLNEMKILAQMSHSNVPTIHKAGEWNSIPYFETDYIEGKSLESQLADCGAFQIDTGLALALEISQTLKYLHSETFLFDKQRFYGILHRDLKPSNILVSPNTGVTLLDFGISSFSKSGRFTTYENGKIVGSMPYMAPEMLSEKEATFKSDIYSLGTVLYEIFTGKRAFPDGDMPRLIQRRMNNLYEPLMSKKNKLPRDLQQLIIAMLEENPYNRPSSMREIYELLGKQFKKWSREESHYFLIHSLNRERRDNALHPMMNSFYGTLSRVAMG